MFSVVLVMVWIMSQGTNKSDGAEQCGGVLTADRGVIQTPQFPGKFDVPLTCRWVIDASQHANSQDSPIVVYFTQMFVSAGLTFTEFDYYEPGSTFQLGSRVIHRVTEENVTTVQWLLTRRHYLVIDFTLDRLEGNHLRALDGLLDVYGFNITYEARREVRNSSCSVVSCSLSGHCYASLDFREYWCECFEGFEGPDCGLGPLCRVANPCENGGTCRQAGSAAVLCLCSEGFTGAKCEVPLQDSGCTDEEGCTSQCPEDGTDEPCACGPNSMPVTRDRARYEGTVRLTNVSAVRSCLESATCSLKPMLTKQITKYLKNSNLSVMEDLRVIDVGFSGEVRFHFWGGKRDGSRVRESLNSLVKRGRLGNVTLVPTHLAITQEHTLHLQSVGVNHPKNQIRHGDEFILSCLAQGSSHMMFRWFKDGFSINVTQSRRNMWTRLLPVDSAGQYTALLGVERAEPLDQGQYTCQVTDWGYQQCKSILLDVLVAPQLKLDPMSLTVEKGDNVTVKCTSPNELQYETRLGYSWTKGNNLFKMTPGLEFWEDLHPGGSILRIYNVQRSVTYTCHIHGSIKSVSRSVRLDLLNRSLVPWCDANSVGGVSWSLAGPGAVAMVDCPVHYSGVATRLCLLIDRQQAVWQTPDFSSCVSDKLAAISGNFHRLTLGYGNTSATDTIFSLMTMLNDHGTVYPGEGEPVITLVHKVVNYLNDSATWVDVKNSTTYFYSVVNTLLRQRNSIINHQKVEELQDVVGMWTALWGTLAGPTSTPSSHLSFDTLVVDMFRYGPGTLRRPVTIMLPKPSLSYPTWYTSRVALHVEVNKRNQNTTSSVAVIVYDKLADFLPQRYAETMENKSEVQYEVVTSLVSVVSRGPVTIVPELELQRTSRPGWEVLCGVTQAPSLYWNLSACLSTHITSNLTQCRCSQLGTYAAVLVKVIDPIQTVGGQVPPQIVLVGCVCCLVQSLLTLLLLALRWWRHRTCLLFLKLQCSTATASTMLAFLYATSGSLNESSYSSVSTILQASVLVSMSSHLSKVLLIYTEVIHLPTIKNLQQTVMCIITGVPLLVVLCNHIAQSTTASPSPSWWITPDSMMFYTCLTCGSLLIAAFIFLYIQVTQRLSSLSQSKSLDTKKAVLRRRGLLHRAAAVLSTTVLMAVSSVIFVNAPVTKFQYLFSFCSALLGFVLLLCYVLHCESPLHIHLLRTLKIDNSYSSDSDSSPLNIFTKQDAEKECEGAPPRTVETMMDQLRAAPLRNGKAEPVREAPPILKTKVPEDCCRTPRTPSKVKAVTFHNDLVTGCDLGTTDQVDMELYPGSPRKYSPLELDPQFLHLPQPEGSARVCVITSVVVDTPSVVVCSVDVEPCSVLNKSIVHAGVQEVLPLPPPVPPVDTSESKEADVDVMDRICHDLDYLLGGLPRELKVELPRPEETVDSTIDSLRDSVQQTSL